MGRRLDADFLVQRSRRKTARWRIARGEIREGLFRLHRPLVVPAIAGGSARSLSPLRQHGFAPRWEMSADHFRRPPSGAFLMRARTPGIPLRLIPGSSSVAPSGRSVQTPPTGDIKSLHTLANLFQCRISRASAGGAKEYKRSGAP